MASERKIVKKRGILAAHMYMKNIGSTPPPPPPPGTRYSPIHAEGILDVRLAVCTSHIGARKVRRSRITPDYFEDKRALIFSRRHRRDRAHSRARGCFEHMDFPEMCKLKCCESALVKIATKLRKQRAY